MYCYSFVHVGSASWDRSVQLSTFRTDFASGVTFIVGYADYLQHLVYLNQAMQRSFRFPDPRLLATPGTAREIVSGLFPSRSSPQEFLIQPATIAKEEREKRSVLDDAAEERENKVFLEDHGRDWLVRSLYSLCHILYFI
jgi:hypothetical protein